MKVKIRIRIFDKETKTYVQEHEDFLMKQAGLNPRIKFESVAIQENGSLIVCDSCGNFGYLDTDRFITELFV